MKKLVFTLYTWVTFSAFTLFLLYFSTLENIEVQYDLSKTLEYTTYFFAFGFLSILLFRALVYSLRFSVDRLSKAQNRQEKTEDAEFRLIIETLLVVITISINTSLVLVNHMLLENTIGRSSDIYAILINVLGIVVFSFISFVWPVIGEIEEKFAKVLFK
ncbi:hypothetical protein GF389_04480 [Candidatus Dojkabacteria bacterium]|nr:hypothetical protein [Candidatus Dojkabacteria bacterium]